MNHLAIGPVPTPRILFYESQPWMLPAAIVVLIILGILWLAARLRQEKDRKMQQDAAAQGHDYGAFQQDRSAQAASTAPPVQTSDAAPDGDGRTQAWTELFLPETAADRLAAIAASHPEFAAQIAAHPNCYPELRAWAHGQRITPGSTS